VYNKFATSCLKKSKIPDIESVPH